MVDLDCFKQINDSLGHRAGDELIVHVAHTLRDRLRETDVLARLSGDEFIVLLPKADRAGAREVARDLLSAVHAAGVPSPDGGSQAITASIGVAMIAGEHDVNCEDIMVAADLAMYAAKDRGRDRFAFYSPDVDYGQGYHLGRPEPAGERAKSAVAVA